MSGNIEWSFIWIGALVFLLFDRCTENNTDFSGKLFIQIDEGVLERDVFGEGQSILYFKNDSIAEFYYVDFGASPDRRYSILEDTINMGGENYIFRFENNFLSMISIDGEYTFMYEEVKSIKTERDRVLNSKNINFDKDDTNISIQLIVNEEIFDSSSLSSLYGIINSKYEDVDIEYGEYAFVINFSKELKLISFGYIILVVEVDKHVIKLIDGYVANSRIDQWGVKLLDGNINEYTIINDEEYNSDKEVNYSQFLNEIPEEESITSFLDLKDVKIQKNNIDYSISLDFTKNQEICVYYNDELLHKYDKIYKSLNHNKIYALSENESKVLVLLDSNTIEAPFEFTFSTESSLLKYIVNVELNLNDD